MVCTTNLKLAKVGILVLLRDDPRNEVAVVGLVAGRKRCRESCSATDAGTKMPPKDDNFVTITHLR
jgi:hypothetical protein